MADALEGWWWERVAVALTTGEPTTADAAHTDRRDASVPP
jgi:hypothetical protein